MQNIDPQCASIGSCLAKGFVALCCNGRVIAFGLLRKFMLLVSLEFVGSILFICECVGAWPVFGGVGL